MSDLSIADVLERAADLIEPEGRWVQGRFGSRDAGCYCIMGALHQVRWDTCEPFEAVVEQPSQFLSEFLGNVSPAHWNDAPDRTQSEVVAKLREAAAKARGEQS